LGTPELPLGTPGTPSRTPGIPSTTPGTPLRTRGIPFGSSGSSLGSTGIPSPNPRTTCSEAPGRRSEAPGRACGGSGRASEAPGRAYGAPGGASGGYRPGTWVTDPSGNMGNTHAHGRQRPETWSSCLPTWSTASGDFVHTDRGHRLPSLEMGDVSCSMGDAVRLMGSRPNAEVSAARRGGRGLPGAGRG
jgi:hypothetical protein